MPRRIPPVRRLLMDAKALIVRSENWCTGRLARGKNNVPANIFGAKATRFCPVGAIWRTDWSTDSLRVVNAKSQLDKSLPGGWQNVPDFNDAPTTTHPVIMRVFNKAIRRAKEQGI